jgi:PAS domain S-box-containing protein
VDDIVAATVGRRWPGRDDWRRWGASEFEYIDVTSDIDQDPAPGGNADGPLFHFIRECRSWYGRWLDAGVDRCAGMSLPAFVILFLSTAVASATVLGELTWYAMYDIYGWPVFWVSLIVSTAVALPILIFIAHVNQRLEQANDRLKKQNAERLAAERALRRTADLNTRLGRLVNHSRDEIYVFSDPECQITQTNATAQGNLGYTESDLLGALLSQFWVDFESQVFTATVEPMRRGEREVVLVEAEFRRRDGTIYPVEIRLQCSHAESQPIIFAMVRDVSDRQKAIDALRLAKNEAELASRAKSQFLANMSHELRTPLNAIIGFSEVICQQTLGPMTNPKYSEYARDINVSGQHLLDLINDILDMSKIESGAADLYDEDLEVEDTIHPVFTIVRNRSLEKQVVLVLELDDDLPMIRADRRKLRQILVNLLDNAIKFTPAGGQVTLQVYVPAAGGVVFEIVDNGIGISAADIDVVLQPFRQVDGHLSRKYAGTGLGLPLAKALTEAHGGVFAISSEIGLGTRIKLAFPAERTKPNQTPMAIPARA